MRGDIPPDYVARMREDWRVARAAHADLQSMGMPHVNLMLVGPPGPIQGMLDLLHNTCAQPVVPWRPGRQLMLPPVAAARTLILEDVGELEYQDQCRLTEWLERAEGRAQVISTSPTPFLPRVAMGKFLDTLYYRLNMVFVDLTA
jgi:hypothetical protein